MLSPDTLPKMTVVEIANSRGTVRVKAKLTTDIKKGVVFLPMHWGKILNSDLNRANNLTHNLVDKRSKEPDFKFAAVEVKRYQKAKTKNYSDWCRCRCLWFCKKLPRIKYQ